MKIRISDHAVRYRLSQADVRLLATSGCVEGVVAFGPMPAQTFRYALCTRQMPEELGASFEEGRMVLYMPLAWALAWPDEERVGFEHRLEVAAGTWLSLLIEKDFPCSHWSEE